MAELSLKVAGFLALTLSACHSAGPSGDNSGAAGANIAQATASIKRTDPCSLVTADEVGQIIGDKIVGTKAASGSCEYDTQDAAASSVTLELNQSDAAGEMHTAKQAAGVLKGMGAEAANGGGAAGADVNAMLSQSGATPKLGDESFFGPNQELSVRKGASYIAVQPPLMRSRMAGGNPLLSDDDKKKMAITIAQKALARLR